MCRSRRKSDCRSARDAPEQKWLAARGQAQTHSLIPFPRLQGSVTSWMRRISGVCAVQRNGTTHLGLDDESFIVRLLFYRPVRSREDAREAQGPLTFWRPPFPHPLRRWPRFGAAGFFLSDGSLVPLRIGSCCPLELRPALRSKPPGSCWYWPARSRAGVRAL